MTSEILPTHPMFHSHTNIVSFRPRPGLRHAAAMAAILVSVAGTCAMDIVGYSPQANDRFDPATFPTTVAPNPNPSFVAAGYDMSSLSFNPVAWLGMVYHPGYALITPKHVVTATHAGVGGPVTFFGTGGQSTSVGFSGGATGTGDGYPFATRDLAFGTLASKLDITSGVQWAPVLDLATKVAGTTSYAAWNGQTIFIAGRNGGDASSGDAKSPRIAVSTIGTTSVQPLSNYSYFSISGPASGGSVTYIGGDSSGATYIPWTDPSGAKLLTVVGTHAAVSGSYASYDNFVSSDKALASINRQIRVSGYAVQMVGNASRYWVGGDGTDFTQGGAWTGGAAPDDYSYVGFDKAQAASQTVTMTAGSQARGLVFGTTSAGDTGFTLSGGSLALGRGGLINYSTHRQTISTNISVMDDQWWIARAGDVRVSGSIQTNGKLVIVDGPHDTELSGLISGTGSIAKEGSGTLTMSGSNSTYSGRTTVHSGTLLAKGLTPLGGGQLIVEKTASVILGAGSKIGNELFLREGSSIGGTGEFVQNLSLTSGVMAKPGDTEFAMGKFSAAGVYLESGGIFDLQISRTGGLGPIAWDSLHSYYYSLRVNSTAESPFVLRLDSLGDTSLGLAPDETVSWPIFTVGTSNQNPTVVGFSADKFVLDTDEFLPQGSFSLSQSGTSIVLSFTAVPEPSTTVLLLLAGLGLGMKSRRRLRR